MRICDKCRITWNRDVNAALNIRHVFLHTNAHGGERPASMRRPASVGATATAAAAASCNAEDENTAKVTTKAIGKPRARAKIAAAATGDAKVAAAATKKPKERIVRAHKR